MPTLFRLDASIRHEGSATRSLADTLQAALTHELDPLDVVHRDVAAAPIDARVWTESIAAASVPEAARSASQQEAQRIATRLADEVLGADLLLFAVPLYNWGVSQHFKTWFDVAVSDPRLGPRTTELSGRPAFLVTARGGAYGPGTPRDGWDHATSWMARALGDAWKLRLQVIETELTLAEANPAMAGLRDQARAQLEAAHEAADQAGRSAASRLRAVA